MVTKYTLDQINDKYMTGDILVTSSFVPTINHFAIVYYQDGVPMVADNVFWSHKLEVTTLEDYKKQRNIIAVIRGDETMNLTDDYIKQKVEKAKNINYKFFDYNCEDFVRDVCKCNIGTDQRRTYSLVFLALLFIVFLILIKNA